MKSKLFTILLVGILCNIWAKAQTYPLVKIHDVVYMSQNTLDSCKIVCKYNNDTVRLRGICVMPGNQSTAYLDSKNVPTTREVYLQDGWGPNSGIDVFTIGSGTKTAPQDIFTLIPGDSIEVTGLITIYDGQIEIEPISKTAGGATYTQNVKFLGNSRVPRFTQVQLSQLVNSKSINQLSTGEQWEGAYVEFTNVTVTTVPVGTRTQFTVADSVGNFLTVFDRFYYQRDGVNGNLFKVPHVGDVFKSIRGVISAYATTGPNCTTGTYELYPFDSTDYVYSLSAPLINSVTRTPLVPTSTNTVTITANVTPFGTRGIKNVILNYKTGIDTSVFTGYTSVTMTASGSNFTATIPAEANGTAVKYWITAVDTISKAPLRSYYPNVKTPGISPSFYTVRDAGLTIYDLQFRPLPASVSPYLGQTVTVSGVVTASLADLGYFYIQQPGITGWAGLNLSGSTSLANFKTGDNVTVTGIVNEAGNYTSLTVTNIVSSGTSLKITPLTILDTLLTSGTLNNRKYMSMLATLKSASGSKMKVVQKNADPTYANGGFGDFRVGENTATPTIGTRVTSGNYSSSDPSTVNLSYINDSSLSKNLKVKAWRVIEVGDNMDSITGIMFYNFGNYKLLPRTNADMYNINNPVAGIENISLPKGNIEIFPNPANGTIHINLNNYAGYENLSINIYDITGKSVYSGIINSSEPRYDLNLNIKDGAYILRVSSANGITGESKLLISK